MELTNEILEKNGFTTNHPERLLTKRYTKENEEPYWYISIENTFVPLMNIAGYTVNAALTANKGVPIKSINCGVLQTVEEVNDAFKLCGIDFVIEA